MDLQNMTLADVEKRLQELDVEVREMTDVAEVEKATEEKKALLERKAELKDLETRKAEAQALSAGEVTPDKIVEERKDAKTMNNVEVRSTQEYAQAYLKAIKGDDSEARALLSTQVSGGQIPVPTFLEEEIKTAWETNELMGLVKKTNYKGNVKIGFELSATGAVVHVEGTDAPTEETITIGTVELKAENIKKWITISDEAIEGTTVDTLGYILKEIAHKIVEKAEEILVGKIVAAPAAATATAVGVPALTADTLSATTIVEAVAMLSAQARNLNIVMNRQTKPAFVALAMAAGYAIDVFDGLADKIVYSDKLPAFSAASAGETYVIVGDFGYGAQANMPNGDDITIKVDDLSLSEKDLVKVVGRQYVGMGLVADRAFVKIKKA